MKTIILLFVLVSAFQTYSQVLFPDSLFGKNGRHYVNFDQSETMVKTIVLNDSTFLGGGYATGPGFEISNALTMFNQCGNPYLQFGDSGLLFHRFTYRNQCNDFVLQPDGKIVIAGIEAPSNAGSQHIPFVCRYNSDGSIDSTFFGTGDHPERFDAISSGGFYSVHIVNGDKILCMGRSTGNINGGVNGWGAMRFNMDGTLDSAFNGDGISRTTNPNGYPVETHGHVLSDGRIVEVASFTNSTTFLKFASAFAMDSIGNVDTTFAAMGFFIDTAAIDAATYTAMQSDDHILLASNFSPADFQVLRITPTGVLDSTFGTGGRIRYAYNGEAKGISLLDSGKIAVLGQDNTNNLSFMVQFRPDGSLDSAFGTNGFLTLDFNNHNGTQYGVHAVQSNGTYYLSAFDFGAGDMLFCKLTEHSNVPHISFNNTWLSTTGGTMLQWYVDSTLIPGATSDTLMPMQNGLYMVTATDSEGCKYLSDTFGVMTVGLPELMNSDFVVYPVPANEKLVVELGESFAERPEVVLISFDGKIVYRELMTRLRIQIDVKSFSKGFYTLELKSANQKAQRKIIIQ